MSVIEPCNNASQIYEAVFTMKGHSLFLFVLHHPKRKLEL